MNKAIKRIILGFLCVGLLLLICIGVLYHNELKSLASLKKLDDYGMYRMIYSGDYGFDDFLKVGAKNDGDIEAFVTKRLLKGVPLTLGVTGDGCSAFVTKNEKGEILYCRNFDFSYAPSLQVFTRPKNGYASVSTVNLSFAGYSKDNLPDGFGIKSFLTLAAPYLPFDGVNEKGVAIALLAVPKVELNNDPKKITLNTTTAIRLVLDHAANIEEAVDCLKQYNLYFSADVNCHYLIADASGKSVLVEFWDGKLQSVKSDEEYQIATNFIAYQGLNLGDGGDEFERYHTIEAAIREHGGALTQQQAVDTLVKVACRNQDGTDRLQWSVVYNLTTLDGEIFAHKNAENSFTFQLKK